MSKFTPNPQRSLETAKIIIGLLLAVGGIWMACAALVQVVSPPSYADLLTRVELPPAVAAALEGMQPRGTTLMRQAGAAFLIQGVLPILIGCWLMQSGGWFRGSERQGLVLGKRSALRRFFIPRMSLALARIEAEAERGYQPFTLGK